MDKIEMTPEQQLAFDGFIDRIVGTQHEETVVPLGRESDRHKFVQGHHACCTVQIRNRDF